MGPARDIMVGEFQSFWVNGLLWKIHNLPLENIQFMVSILLGQWITLEANG